MNPLRRSLDLLEAAGIEHCVRNAVERIDDPQPGKDVDVMVEPSQIVEADAVVRAAGLRELRAPGHPGHRFYLAPHDGLWLKLDLIADREGLLRRRVRRDGTWVASDEDQQDHARLRAEQDASPDAARGRLRRLGVAGVALRIRRRLPAAGRRLGVVVAVVGPDGSGKGTVIARLGADLPVGVSHVYLGWRARGAPSAAPGEVVARPAAPHAPPPLGREVAFVVRKALVMWARLARAYALAWRGHVVLCDRHPSELLVTSSRHHRLASLVERLLLWRLTPRPDAILLLSAPAAALHARKPEHDLPTFERLVGGYRDLYGPMGADIVPTDGSVDDAVMAASAAVWRVLAERRGWDG